MLQGFKKSHVKKERSVVPCNTMPVSLYFGDCKDIDFVLLMYVLVALLAADGILNVLGSISSCAGEKEQKTLGVCSQPILIHRPAVTCPSLSGGRTLSIFIYDIE